MFSYAQILICEGFGHFNIQNLYCTLFSKKADYEIKTEKIIDLNYCRLDLHPVKVLIYRNILLRIYWVSGIE